MPTVMTVHESPDDWIRMEPVVRALHASALLRPVRGTGAEPRDDVESLVEALRPDAVLVESASPRALAAARAASRLGLPVAHLSAGRRAGDRADGVAEEPGRRELDRLSRLHLAPTEHAARVLLAASVPEHRIVVTGDPLIDTVLSHPRVPSPAGAQPIVLVVAHRPQHAGAPVRRLGAAVRILAARFPGHAFVLSADPDLAVHAGLGSELGRAANIHSLAQPRFEVLLELIGRSALVLTDCTRIEEVAPSCDVPVLVLGDTTARPEGVLAGTSAVMGTRVERMVEEASGLLADPVRHASMAGAPSPFGDGRAAERVVAALAELLGCGTRLPDFVTPLRREPVAAR
ncbi:UDP-N-acetylglucosamine 2-epimerase [Leifsonia virtsii]|uniref:UDP-N-acetylglucosamine 2-epimerase (non-hydrolyzing) n=1 Tax=Leifsonia virtsii TaxID=3035915 RepID=A0ABT8IZU3_9MICO|nr:UDP-N-acetylglucosamine 2-epimerase [Leifsonia virtsii]MDN4598222.1 UDP-N-acetylglucosamine 2-epimerase [Leifsonia virtsii]